MVINGIYIGIGSGRVTGSSSHTVFVVDDVTEDGTINITAAASITTEEGTLYLTDSKLVVYVSNNTLYISV